MEIWVDHYYADHLREGILLYAPYFHTFFLNYLELNFTETRS